MPAVTAAVAPVSVLAMSMKAPPPTLYSYFVGSGSWWVNVKGAAVVLVVEGSQVPGTAAGAETIPKTNKLNDLKVKEVISISFSLRLSYNRLS